MYLAGEAGVSMLGVYLFITFGNGFRYGRSYLFACQLLCLIGFTVVLLTAPYWAKHQVAGWGLMIALVVLPLYVSTLLKRIQEARNKAEEANRAKSSFLANMSHEMRTPLNGIVGVADLLNTTSLTLEQSELIRLLRHSVALLRSLVDDVLDISKIEAGRLSLEDVNFDLHALLNGLLRMLRTHATAKGLKLHSIIDPAIEFWLRGDPHHLRQVLLNLLSNALKFTSAGEVSVRVSLISETESSVRVRFEVSDTGIGIPLDAQAKIFEQFVQADDSTTRRFGGTGLGTAIAKQLVELMGGQIGVRSQVGVGSTFWFELSLGKPERLAGDEHLGATGQPGGAEAVLIADHVAVAGHCMRALDAAGCAIRQVVELSNALSWLHTHASKTSAMPQVIAVSATYAKSHELLQRLSNDYAEQSVAIVYLLDGEELTVDQANQLRKLPGVSVLANGSDQRLLRNAIHAAYYT